MLASLAFFAIGSAICGSAQSLEMLIAGRSMFYLTLICSLVDHNVHPFSCARHRYVGSSFLVESAFVHLASRWRRHPLFDGNYCGRFGAPPGTWELHGHHWIVSRLRTPRASV